MLSNCPGTEFVGMALKSSKRRKIHPRVFPFSKKKKKPKTGDFTLLFCRGRERNVPECVTHVCRVIVLLIKAHCFSTFSLPSWLLKLPNVTKMATCERKLSTFMMFFVVGASPKLRGAKV